MSEKKGAVTFKVRAQPRAARTEIVGEYAGALKVRLAAPPVDGKANEECKRFFAKLFDVPQSSVEIVTGDASKDKIIRIHGVSLDQALAVIRT